MKSRETPCKFYMCNNGPCGNNSNKTCSFHKEMQHCTNYVPDTTYKPPKKNLKKEKRDKLRGSWKDWE